MFSLLYILFTESDLGEGLGLMKGYFNLRLETAVFTTWKHLTQEVKFTIRYEMIDIVTLVNNSLLMRYFQGICHFIFCIFILFITWCVSVHINSLYLTQLRI